MESDADESTKTNARSIKGESSAVEYRVDSSDEEHDGDMTLPLSSDEQGSPATQNHDPCSHFVDIIMKLRLGRGWMRHRHLVDDFG